VGHTGASQQVADVPLLDPHPPVLDAADLRPGAADLIPRPVGRDAGRLAQPAELVSQHDAEDRGAAACFVSGWLAAPLLARLDRTHPGSGNRLISTQCPPQTDGERHATALRGEAGGT